MEKTPNVNILIVAILLRIILMGSTALIFYLLIHCGAELHKNDTPMLLLMCSSFIFLSYIITMWCVKRKFSFNFLLALIFIPLIINEHFINLAVVDLGTVIIFIFIEIIIMWCFTFSAFPILKKEKTSKG